MTIQNYEKLRTGVISACTINAKYTVERKPVSAIKKSPYHIQLQIQQTKHRNYRTCQREKNLIYTNKCHCTKCAFRFTIDTMIARTAVVDTISGKQAKVTVMYCQGCGEYYSDSIMNEKP